MTLRTPAERTTAGPPAPRRGVRPLLLRLHFYAAVFVAPFVLVAAASGALYALSPQISDRVYAEELTTDSRGPALPLEAQVEAARAAEPDLPLLAVRPAPGPGDTTRVLLDGGESADSLRETVFVDPVTGDVQGDLTTYGTSGSTPVTTWLDELHRSLHLGPTGRLYSELAASWLGIVALAGLVLWWTGPRRGSRLRPSREGGRRRRLLSWHGALGTWVVLGMLMLSATGLTWSQHAGANVTDLRAALSWSTPAVVSDLSTGGAGDEHAGHGGGHGGAPAAPVADSPGVGLQAAYDTARGEGLDGPLEVGTPAGAGGAYVVQEIDRSWPTQVDAASVDPATGEVVDVVRFDDYPLPAKLARWGTDLHMGVLFGLPNQVALVLLSGAIVAMIVLGYRAWWLRRPTRGPRTRLPRAAPRGAWRSLSPPVLVAVVLGTALVGWFLPLLGLSLLAFLAVDVVLGRLGRDRAPADPDAVALDQPG